jgi:hypothetical protein
MQSLKREVALKEIHYASAKPFIIAIAVDAPKIKNNKNQIIVEP